MGKEGILEKVEGLGKAREEALSLRKARRRDLKQIRKEIKISREAFEIVQIVGRSLLEETRDRVTDLGTLALSAIFDEDYRIDLHYETKRGQGEASFVVVKEGLEISPLHSSGGGVVDVVSFSLRIAILCLIRGIAPVVMLDEPFRHLSVSGGMQSRASEMLQRIGKDLGIQFIVVTHEEEFIGEADRVFDVRIKRGISRVQERD